MRKKLFFLFFLFFVCSAYLPLNATTRFIYPFPNSNFENSFCEEDDDASFFVAKTPEQLVLEKSKNLEERLSSHIYGQEVAVKETANAIVRYAAGINDPSSVIASLLYCGASGVGKTELARQLTWELYGDMSYLIRINMSEYSESHTISRLIGSPPGYVGYEEGGQLTSAVLKNPYSIILIDEIEKAHPKVLKLFLHVFDAGYFTSARGKIVDCKKCIFISTSNLAALEIADMFNLGFESSFILETLRPVFMQALSPELFNRMDPIIFSPLTSEIVEKLVSKMLSRLQERVFNAKKIHLVFDRTLIDYLISKGIDPILGARPLRRIIEKELSTVIAKVILEGNCKKDDRLTCFFKEDSIILEKN